MGRLDGDAQLSALKQKLDPARAAPVNIRWLSMLQEMGFAQADAERALALTGSLHMDQAIEYLLGHPGAGPSDRAPGPTAAQPGPSTAAIGAGEDVPIPTRLPSLHSIVGIACGSDSSAAVDASGVAYTWGRNRVGQLGLNCLEDQPAPRVVESLRGRPG